MSDIVINHYKVMDEVLWQLMALAQRLCPGGEWVFQLMANYGQDGKGQFMATVTNGDDNVTAIEKTPEAAVAKLLFFLLDGAVFPLVGHGGMKLYPGDRGWVRAEAEDSIEHGKNECAK